MSSTSTWEPPESIRQLAEYAQSYMDKFNSLRVELSRAGSPASLYGEELARADLYVGSDGIVISYLTTRNQHRAGVEPGVEVWDYTDEPISTLTQRISSSKLKIYQRQLGDDVLSAPSIPADLPSTEISGGVEPDFLEPFLKSGTGAEILVMVVGPHWQVENGKLLHPSPTRLRVLSPCRPIPPDGRLVLQFIFPFVDIVWKHEELQLNDAAGEQFAITDIEVLMLGVRAGIPPKQLAENPFESVAAHCEKQCDELFKLIDNQDTKEPAVQAFLEKPENQFLIAPHARAVYPRKPLGGNRFIPDFTAHRPDGDYHFVEIESPNNLIYQEKGEEPTAAFNHAIVQVEDWFRYIDQNLLTVRMEDNMPTLNKPTGEVVIGRDKHLGDTARIRFQYKRGESHKIAYKTYDMLVEAGRAYAASIRRMMGPRS